MSLKTRRSVFGMLAVVLSLSILPAPRPAQANDAQPEQVYEITGGGNAHGVGMSQRGARGRANAGQTHEQILAFYYSDHPLVTRDTSATDIRVLLADDTPPTATKPIRIIARSGSWASSLFATYEQPFPADSYLDVVWDEVGGWIANVHDAAGGVLDSAPLTSSVQMEPAADTTLFEMNYRDNIPRHNLNRGQMRIILRSNGLLRTVNIVNVEDYVRGVVACEMPSSYPVEALRAQAVASRSYGMSKIKSSGAFDVYSYRINQVYGGVNCETTRTNNAVAATTGKIVADKNGNPAETIFHDTAGGHTESAEYAWPKEDGTPGSKYSYLKGRPDVDASGVPYEAGAPSLSWNLGEVTHSELSAILGQGNKTNVGQLISFEFNRGVSGRVHQAVLVGSAGTKSVSGAIFKNVFDKYTSGPTLRSTLFYFTPKYDFSVPTVPQNLKAVVGSDNSVHLTWDHSVGLGPITYRVFRNGTGSAYRIADNLSENSFTDKPAAGTHYYTVRARDSAGTLSDFSAPVSVTVADLEPDTTPPSVPQNLRAMARDDRYVDLAWDASTDDRPDPITYRVFRDGTGSANRIADNLSATSFTDRPSEGTHYYTVRARDAAGNMSDHSLRVTVTAVSSTAVDTTPPTVSKPRVTLRSGVVVGTGSTPVRTRASFSATDPSGLLATGLQLRANTGSYTNVSLPSATATEVNINFATHQTTTRQLRARATDKAGNQSDWTVGDAFRVVVRQDGASGVIQKGSWKTGTNSGFYGGSVRHSKAAGASQSWKANVSSFAVVSTLGPNRGRAEVWVDGVRVAKVDLYASSVQRRRVVYAVDFGSAAQHTIELRVAGTKNSKSSGTRVDFDAFLAIAP
jgi:stage II sporulation protein D